GVQGVLLPLSGHEDGPPLRPVGAVDDRYRAAPGWRAVRSGLLRCLDADGGVDPGLRGLALSPRRLDLGSELPARDHARLVARQRVSAVRLARVQRGDDPLPPGVGIADASRRLGGVGRVREHLSLGDVLRAELSRLSAVVRLPVLARVDRLPGDSRRVYAGPR